MLNPIASILIFLFMGCALFLVYVDSSKDDWKVNPGFILWLMCMALILTLMFF